VHEDVYVVPCGTILASIRTRPHVRDTEIEDINFVFMVRQHAHIERVYLAVKHVDTDTLDGSPPLLCVNNHLLCLPDVKFARTEESPNDRIRDRGQWEEAK
jgi:hypothetical protein